MTEAEIEAEIAIQKQIAAACSVEILALIHTKSTYNTSTGQTQLMVVNRRIAEMRGERKEALAEVERLECLLYGGTIQVRPYA